MEPQWTILSSLAAALVGGVVVHFLTLLRDERTEARKMRTEWMVRAYRVIVRCANEGVVSAEQAKDLELAFNDLILLGNAEQVELALHTVQQTAEDGALVFNPLMRAIRDDLRDQLGLSRVDLPEGALYFTIEPPDQPQQSRSVGARRSRS